MAWLANVELVRETRCVGSAESRWVLKMKVLTRSPTTVWVFACVWGAWPSKERSDEAKWRRLASPGFEGEIDGGKVRLWR